ncbi:ParA family protein [Nocardiopsis changdeensis]|uniref:ParA family protein n=1 Tax=Nocardiopsis changdeensis TaxID=2831969 RepID=A0A975KST3_9ACTN|nr:MULTISPECIES: ParA family protein [Nocardiopsis]QUX26476.1 ParA family protein [Nocardiopsis changdeensis]QYX40748.1 ParA family protein [Nocardiopsis sp. MT53]
MTIYTVAAWKGGVGKSTIAYELAWQLDAVLLDLDFDDGGVTKSWGYNFEDRVNAPLLDAISSGKTPRFLNGRNKPDLLPSHRDLERVQPDVETMQGLIRKWAADWGRDIVIDTHPGGLPLTYAAMGVAKVTVSPVTFGQKEFKSLEAMTRELADYPILIVPNKTPISPPQWAINRLEAIEAAGFDIADPLPNETWIPNRQIRIPITREPVPKRAERFEEGILALGEKILSYE